MASSYDDFHIPTPCAPPHARVDAEVKIIIITRHHHLSSSSSSLWVSFRAFLQPSCEQLGSVNASWANVKPTWANFKSHWTNLAKHRLLRSLLAYEGRGKLRGNFKPTWAHLAPTWSQLGAKLHLRIRHAFISILVNCTQAHSYIQCLINH